MFSVSGMIRNVSSPITVTNATTGKQTTVFGTACIFFAFFCNNVSTKRSTGSFFQTISVVIAFDIGSFLRNVIS